MHKYSEDRLVNRGIKMEREARYYRGGPKAAAEYITSLKDEAKAAEVPPAETPSTWPD